MRHCLLIPLLLGLALPAAATTERSRVLVMGKPAGWQVAEYADDAGLSVHYEYADRGRGPSLDVRYTFLPYGRVGSVDLGGVNYMKVPVQEAFAREGAAARWKNGAEEARRDDAAAAFYLGLDRVPEDTVLLARALLAAPQQRLPLLPDGEARIERLGSERVDGLRVDLYAVHGLDLTPTYLWLDAQQRFFASWSSWQSLVREGHEGALERLAKRQQAEEGKLAAARARALTTRLTRPLLLRRVRVFDPAAAAVAEHQSVLIADGRIVAVGADVAAPREAEVIDGQDRFLMPGLWDMHAHYQGDYEGLIRLACGVTTVRDLANDADALAARSADIEAGRDIGPRILKAGFIDGRSEFSGPTKVFADTEAEAAAAVDDYARHGYEQIKIYSSVKPELVPVIARLAHARGLRVSGHVPAFMSPRQFVEGGADEIQHINFVLMGFITDVAHDDTRTPLRLSAVAQRAGALDPGGADLRAWIDELHRRGTVVDPTLSAFENLLLERPRQPGPSWQAWIDRLPPQWQRSLRSGNGGLPMSDGQQATYRQSWQRLIEVVGVLYRSGVTLVAGTDDAFGTQLPRELELYVQAGIPPREVLRLATLGAAEVMKHADRYGRVAPGYVADLVLIDGDPTVHMGDLRKTRLVIRGDRRYEPRALLAALGIKAD